MIVAKGPFYMVSRKPRKSPVLAAKRSVELTGAEQELVGRKLLAVTDFEKGSKSFDVLMNQLGLWATERANVSNVLLRSDFIAQAEPLAKRAATFAKVVGNLDGHLSVAIRYKKFVDFAALGQQLHGFEQFVAWLRSEPSKKGGERSAFKKECDDRWKEELGRWFDATHRVSDDPTIRRNRTRFLNVAQRAVLREVESDGTKGAKSRTK